MTAVMRAGQFVCLGTEVWLRLWRGQGQQGLLGARHGEYRQGSGGTASRPGVVQVSAWKRPPASLPGSFHLPGWGWGRGGVFLRGGPMCRAPHSLGVRVPSLCFGLHFYNSNRMKPSLFS